ncbi:hypothetical protein KIH27_15795 [Mycobacterium sp. M1]|uniref:DUF3052 domain-containing protein n=1 Tax=Mycolicibacter acidiphilus TaxID=2835306 RepID=A0ABS5RL63_9MYCO|nr:hypothetical protein [Mycolicibacter acidiphilus]MBS9535052.1 hypothetical protein [Mycolicibacter acidiphilus]
MTTGLYDLDETFGLAELEQRLLISRNERVAVINAPQKSGLRLLAPGQPQPDQADVVIAFATRKLDLHWIKAAYHAAHSARVAWVIYPKPGQPGTDLRWEWLLQALRQYGLNVVQDVSLGTVWSAARLRPIAPRRRPEVLSVIDGETTESAAQHGKPVGEHLTISDDRAQ